MLHSPTTESPETTQATHAAAKPEPRRELHPPSPRGALDLGSQPDGSHVERINPAWQRAIGNQGVLRLLSHSKPAIQTKLAINQPGDKYEHEADHVAEQVMRMVDPAAPVTASSAPPGVQRTCTCESSGSLCPKCEHESESGKTLHRKQNGAAPAEAPPIVHQVLRSPGQPLDASSRAFFEPRFGYDFSHVRVHSDSQAAESARAINARAYASGPHMVFGSGQLDAGSTQSRKLLAHELSHIVQQGHGKPNRSSAAATGTDGLVQRSPLDDLIKQLEFDLIDARDAASKQKQQIVASGGIKAWNRYSRSATKSIYNIQERLSAVRQQQASPGNQRTLYDVSVVALEFGDQVGGKTLTGNKVKSLQNVHGGFPRTFDTLSYIEGSGGEVLGAQPVELKSEGARTENSLLAKSVKGGINRGDIEANYRDSSTIAKQLEKTATLTQAASDAEGRLVLRGRDAITDQEVTIRVAPERLSQERITSYGRLPEVLTVPVPRTTPSGSSTGGIVSNQVNPGKKPGGGSSGSSGSSGGGAASTGNAPEQRTTEEVGVPIEPVVEATPGYTPDAFAGAGGAVQLIEAFQVGSLQANEMQKYQARLAELQPKIDAYMAQGNSVRLVLVVEQPVFDFGCAIGAFCDQGDLVYFRELFIDYVESDQPKAFHAPSPNDPPAMSAPHVLHDSGSRDGFIPTVSQGGSLTEDWEIRSGTAKHANHHLASAKTILSPPVSLVLPPTSAPPHRKPAKPKLSSPEVQQKLAAAPSKVYLLSGNIKQYATGWRIERSIEIPGVFSISGRATAGSGSRAETAVIYWNNLDQHRAELLAKLLRSQGLPLAHTESGGPGDRDPGDLQINFGKDAEQ
jgi:hypothetical protein